MTPEPSRHQIAVATQAVAEALRRSNAPEDLARAALFAASVEPEVQIPVPLSLADLAPEQVPEVGSLVYLTFYNDENIIPARITAREVDRWMCKVKLSHPDAPNLGLKGVGHVKWFGGEYVFATKAHAYLKLAQKAEDMRQAIHDSLVDEQRSRDRYLAYAEDEVNSQVDPDEVGRAE